MYNLEWFYLHENNFNYATIAGAMALLRASWINRDGWCRRFQDAAICILFAFNLQPAVEIGASIIKHSFPDYVATDLFTNEHAVRLLAAFLGFLGTDCLFEFLRKKIGHHNEVG